MDDKTKKFLEENFKAGEYVTLTIMVKLTELNALVDKLSNSGLNLAIIPQVKEAIDFSTDKEKVTGTA